MSDLAHSLNKFGRNQWKLPKKPLKALARQGGKRAAKKFTRYKSGKFRKQSFEKALFHLIEEVNEWLKVKFQILELSLLSSTKKVKRKRRKLLKKLDSEFEDVCAQARVLLLCF